MSFTKFISSLSPSTIALTSAIIGTVIGFILFCLYESYKTKRKVAILKKYAKAELNKFHLENPLVDRFLNASTSNTTPGKSRIFTSTYLPNTLRLIEYNVLDPVRDRELISMIIDIAKKLDIEKSLCFYASIEATLQIEGHESSTYKNNVVEYKKEIREICKKNS